MGSQESSKAATPKVQRGIIKNTKVKASPATLKKAVSTKKIVDKNVAKVDNSKILRTRTKTVPKVTTPKRNIQTENIPMPDSVTKSAKKSAWKRRPKPAHSGVPVPEKMRKLFEKQLLDLK